ncbi:hypothetical protein CRG98_047563, partial [Punica granatum]
EKSRGSGRGSRKTRFESYGWVTRVCAAAAVRGKTGRHASSGHGTKGIGGNEGCARLVGPRTVTTSSRRRVRVVRNPLNVRARLAEVVGRNGMSEGSVCAARSSRDPIAPSARK